MALSGVCFVPSKLVQNLLLLSSSKQGRRPTRLFFASTTSSCCFAEERRRESNHNHPKEYYHLPKRMLNLSIVAAAAAVVILASPTIKVMAEEEHLELQSYTDSKQGFTLLIPPSWIKVDKAGATVLFEEPNKAANNVGVVVNPVRLMNLQQFGTPQFVADKLILAEKRKESTKDAKVIAVSERSGKGGLQVYEFEYKIDSTRGGVKRIFSAAFVASKKLYILNIAHTDKPESPLDMHRRRILEQVLHSFDAVPLT